MMTPFEYYINAFEESLNFSGRASRTAFWSFIFFHSFAIGITLVLDWIVGQSVSNYTYIMASCLAKMAVTIRRLHDVNRSGWWMLIGIIPLIGSLTLLLYFWEEGHLGDNQYGSNPKGLTEENEYV